MRRGSQWPRRKCVYCREQVNSNGLAWRSHINKHIRGGVKVICHHCRNPISEQDNFTVVRGWEYCPNCLKYS
jgi:hypothetical protein